MKRYKITHRTYYNFSDPVQLKPHTLRLRPKEGHELRVESSALKIEPTAKLRWYRDVEDNSVAIATFTESARHLRIESEVIIQHYNEAPLDFLVADYALSVPFVYRPEDAVLLQPYLTDPAQAVSDQVKAWVEALRPSGEPVETYVLLRKLTEHIQASLTYRVREEPGVQSADETLTNGTGSCRDFAYLFMVAARHLGLAARFVSGYLYVPLPTEYAGATHAWAEVFLPGAGWKGFDPTIGAIVGTDHIPVAVARLPESVPPVGGAYVGSASSQLDVGVWVTELA